MPTQAITSVVICVRDPDASNDYVVFAEGQPEPLIIDVDYGYADLRDKEELDDWCESHLATVKELYAIGTPNAVEAGQYLANLVGEAIAEYGS